MPTNYSLCFMNKYVFIKRIGFSNHKLHTIKLKRTKKISFTHCVYYLKLVYIELKLNAFKCVSI